VSARSTDGKKTRTNPFDRIRIAVSEKRILLEASFFPRLSKASSCRRAFIGAISWSDAHLRRDGDGIVLASAVGTPGAVRFAANHSVTVPTAIHYDRVEGGSPSTLTIVVRARHDTDRRVQASLGIPVSAFQSCQPPREGDRLFRD
jgi:hypothetical protein